MNDLADALIAWSDGLRQPLPAAREALRLLGWDGFVARFEQAPDEVLHLTPEGRAFAAEVDRTLAGLSPNAMAALCWGSCCEGGFVLAETSSALDGWLALVACGWLTEDAGRHRIPEPLRVLVRHRISAEQRERAERAHAHHYLSRARSAAPGWRRRERPNLEAIARRFDTREPAWCVEASLALAPVLRFDEPATRLRERLLKTLAAAERAGRLSGSVRAELATQMVDHGAFDDALRWLRPRAEDRAVEARLGVFRGHIQVWREDYEGAAAAFTAAEANIALIDDEDTARQVALHLALQRGFLALERGDPDAGEQLEAALRTAERAQCLRGITIGLHLVGRHHLREGRPAAAMRFLLRARARHLEEGDLRSVCFNDAWLARAHRVAGERDAALEAARRAHAFAAGGVSDALELLSLIELAALGEWPDPTRMRATISTVGVPQLRRQAEAWLAVQHRPKLALSADGSRAWFEGQTIDLRRHGASRRIMVGLAEAAQRDPLAPLDTDALFAAGWPGENIASRSRTKRVHTAIWTLRRLGLGDVLHTDEHGYRLLAAIRPPSAHEV